MSFASLQAARKRKESKSYVIPIATPATSDALESATSSGQITSTKALKQTDGLYSSLPQGVEIRSSEFSGRGIWSNVSYKPGDVLLAIRPHASILSSQYLESHCSSCAAPGGAELKRCTRCRTVWYCDSACQNKDWAQHKSECTALQKWAASAPSAELALPNEAVRCLGRILYKRQKQGSESIWAQEIDQMQSHRTSLQPAEFESHTHLAHSVVRYLGLSSPSDLAEFGLASAGDLVDIISRFVTNTFTWASPSLTPLGIVVSPLVALFNHSCDPNAVIVFPRSSNDASAEPLMHVVILRPIAAGEEVLTAYIDTTLPREQRQKLLKETYHFTCCCTLCRNPPVVDVREAMLCPKSCGGMCPVPTEENGFTRCIKCKAVVSSTDAVLDALRVGQEALDKATFLQTKDPEKALQLTFKLIPILTSASLVPASHPLLALTRLHQSLLLAALTAPLTQAALDEAVRATAKSAAGVSTVLAVGHPVRGISLAELGKILAVDEPTPTPSEDPAAFPPSGPARLRLAYDTLLRARQELLIGFGVANGGGLVGAEVRESAVALEKELAVWKQGVRNVIADRPKQK